MVVTFCGCSDGRQIQVVGGTADSVVFAVHLDADREPISTSGPYRLDNGQAVVTEIPPDETGLRMDTEFVAFDLGRIEEVTASFDQSPRQNLRFSRDLECWKTATCNFSMQPGLPEDDGVVRTFGESVGWREFVPSIDLTTMPDDDNAGWLSKLSLRAPFDQHLVESARLIQFPAADTWADSLPFDDEGIIDLVPLDRDRVIILWSQQICIVRRTDSADAYCEPGPRTLTASDVVTDGRPRMWRMARALDDGSNLDRIYLIVNSNRGHLYAVDVDEAGFGARRLLASSDSKIQDVAVGPDGAIVAPLTAPMAQTLRQVLEFSPTGEPRTGTEIERQPNENTDIELAATTSQTTPFLVVDQDGFARRASGGEWLIKNYETQGGVRDTKAIGGVEGTEGFDVWTVHNHGLAFRFRSGRFAEQPVAWAMPNEYAETCEVDGATDENRLLNDIRALHIVGPHEGYALIKDCAVIVRFDPSANDEEDLRTVSIFHAGLIDGTWPRIGDKLEPFTLVERDGVLWIGGGAALYTLQTDSN